MKIASPLRYPGGKASMAKALCTIRGLNHLNGHAMAEPFAGGAGASLSLLYLRETHAIHINDFDPAIHDFWYSVVYENDAMISYLEEVPVSVEEWKRWKKVYKSSDASRLERGFAAFYLNRCNRSGIIDSGGIIGGLEQAGRWKIDVRFNKDTLRERLERIADERDRILVTGIDGIEFLDSIDPQSSFFFIDPPYYKKGPTLYLNGLDPSYHVKLAEKLHGMSDAAWALTYDNCREVRDLYEEWAVLRPFSLRRTSSDLEEGREILITPAWLQLPTDQSVLPLSWR